MTGAGRLRDTFVARPLQRVPHGRKARVAPPRTLVLAGRAMLWSLLALLVALGATTLYGAVVGAAPEPPAAEEVYPVRAAEGLAVRFAQAYLAGDQQAVDALSGGRVAAARHGTSATAPVVGGLVVAATEIATAQQATVTVAAQVGDGWVYLAVPVWAAGSGELAVAGSPTLVSPPRTGQAPQVGLGGVDSRLGEELEPELAAFFRAYADSSQAELDRFAAPGVELAGLGGAVAFDRLAGLEAAPAGPGRARADATVVWQTADGLALSQTYRLELIRRDGDWFVADLGPPAPPASERRH